MAYIDQSEGSKALDQREHNRDANAKRVILRGQNPSDGEFVNIAAVDNGDGTFGLSTSGSGGSGVVTYKTKIDKSSTTNVIYIGEAAIGSATNTAAWKITKIDKTVTDNVEITYRNAGAFTNAWDDRLTGTYS